MNPSSQQDQEHLKLLEIFHYIVGGLAALFACFPIIHLIVGLALLSGAVPTKPGDPFPTEVMGWFFVIIPAFFMMAGWALAAAIITTGWFLAQRKNRMFCLVVAGIECAFMPFGTALGIFTIIVLMRESVGQMFPSGGASVPASQNPATVR